MRRANLSIPNNLSYEMAGLFLALFFLVSSGYLFYKIIPSFTIFSFGDTKNTKVYFLISKDTLDYIRDSGYDVAMYKKRLNVLKSFLQKKESVQVIHESDLSSLPSRSVVVAFDVFNLSSKNEEKITNFLKKGGKLLFNYHFGYFIDGKFQGDRLLRKITGLEALEEVKAKNAIFITPDFLSPISFDFTRLRRFDYILYDKVPLFVGKKEPDAVMSNWQSTMTPIIQKKRLPLDEAGVMWHGNYGKGSWVYFVFPSYSATDESYDMFDYFVNGAIAFLQRSVSVVKYPYIRYDKVVFISEDTEYQYQNLAHFASLADEYKIPVTAFCVAKLALQYPEITKKVSQLPSVEIGSHSYSHTKIVGSSDKKMEEETLGSKLILEKITGKKVIGFRPPREEIDKRLAQHLIDAGYLYTMEKAKSYFYPKEEYKGLITIPRHGTDDYSYLINLEWNASQILHQILSESTFLTKLHLLYTLSVHTHLLCYGSNIEILRNYFQYLRAHPDITPLKGKEIAKLSRQQKKIDIVIHQTAKKVIFDITNNNKEVINGFTFRVYYNNLSKLRNFESEIVGVNVKVVKRGDKFVDLRIDRLQPQSRLAILADYVQ